MRHVDLELFLHDNSGISPLSEQITMRHVDLEVFLHDIHQLTDLQKVLTMNIQLFQGTISAIHLYSDVTQLFDRNGMTSYHFKTIIYRVKALTEHPHYIIGASCSKGR